MGYRRIIQLQRGARAADFFSTKYKGKGGCSFFRAGEKCSLDSKNYSAVRATPKINSRPGIEPTTCGYVFKTIHGNLSRGRAAGRLSRPVEPVTDMNITGPTNFNKFESESDWPRPS